MSRKTGQASKQRRWFGLSPKRPYLKYVVGPVSYLDNFGACLPYYYLAGQQGPTDVDT